MVFMNRKKTLAIVIVAVLIITCGILLWHITRDTPDDDKGDSYDQNIKILNQSYPTQIVLYGDEIKFRDALVYEETDNIESSIESFNKKKYKRMVIIINDLAGNAKLNEGDCLAIKAAIDEGLTDVYYLGIGQFSTLQNAGIWNGSVQSGDLSMVTALYNHTYCFFSGVWTDYDVSMTQNNPEALGQVLVSQMVRCIRSNN